MVNIELCAFSTFKAIAHSCPLGSKRSWLRRGIIEANCKALQYLMVVIAAMDQGTAIVVPFRTNLILCKGIAMQDEEL